MMELDMWNDDLLVGGWSLPVDHSGGLFGDLKSEGCLCGDDPLGLQLQDAVEHVESESPFRNEDILGAEWMESDIGSLLEVMGNSDQLLSLEASLNECMYSTAPDEQPVSFVEPVADHDSKLCNNSSRHYSAIENFLSSIHTNDQSTEMCTSKVSVDTFLSPPSSPEQVAPIIKVEPIGSTIGVRARPLSLSTDTADLFSDEFDASVVGGGVFSGLEFTSVAEVGDSVVTFDDANEFIASPLSADDVDSMLSSSVPTSPSSVNHSSIIESSPELYRVIVTSSLENARFSPYSKPKASKPSRASGKTRAPAEPVPDHIIGEQLNKKDRKKLQNKNAAIRYRMKKKEEAVGIKTEEQVLEETNLELKGKVEDLQREIKYMKNLMEDVLRAKGLM